jgi:transposase
VRDLPIGGRPVVLAWRKRLWRCREPACGVRTWTERTVVIRPRAVLTERARAQACRRVGTDAHAVARDLGVGWATIMRAVADHGIPLVEDPTRLDGVGRLGLDETTFHEGHPPGAHPLRRGYASALVVPLGHATVVVDHFHAIKLANMVVDQVRRRTQQATLGHRGRTHDPLYRIRKPLVTAAEQLTSRDERGCGPGWRSGIRPAR